MGKQAAVVIGIKRAGNLVELPGALNGAREFCEWARARGYLTSLVTDEKKPVTAAQLKRLIKRIVDKVQPDRLLLYFAGHGIQPTVNTAYWLLSGWEADSDEAVNFNLSCYNAKRSGIGQIAVFADACRSTVPGAATVGGSSIFPKTPAAAGQPEWDQFLACRLEEISQEVSTDKAAEAYGFFTRCLMSALKGEAREAIEEPLQGALPRGVTSQKLARYLKDAVPTESGRTKGAVVQFPDLAPGWQPPDNIYVGLPSVRDAEAEVVPESKKVLAEISRGGGKPKPVPARAEKAVARARKHDEATAKASTQAFASSQGRARFETRKGLSIIGALPVKFVTRGRAVGRGGTPGHDLFEENGAWHVRGSDNDEPESALIALKGGNWIAACLLPNFVGTIVVKDGFAASVNYAPSTNGPYPYEAFTDVAPVLNRWTALMHQGRHGDMEQLTSAAQALRRYKHSNPSLGILAAYAYERAGVIAEIDDIAWWFAVQNQPVPFDVAMLSTALLKRKQGKWTVAPRDLPAVVAGSYPLLTQGWSFLDPSESHIRRELFELRAGLLPALWTTLRAAEGKKLAALVYQGKLL